MSMTQRKIFLFALMGIALITVGFLQSWNVALAIFNMCIISAIMTLGVNIQWGYAGLFNAGIMGFQPHLILLTQKLEGPNTYK